MMSAIDPRLLKALGTAKAAGIEIEGFEIGPRSIKIQRIAVRAAAAA